jgi:galactokinase
MEHQTLEQALRSGALDQRLAAVYGAGGLAAAKKRCAAAAAGFTKTFESLPEAFFSAPGRTELGGNHTDHQHGRVLAAAVDLDILAAAAPNQSGMLRVQSQGYP